MGAYTITENCIGCTLCARNCPVKAITGRPKERHVIDADVCIGCGLCGKLCPKEAILDGRGKKTARIPKTEWEKPQIDEDLCAGCSVCVANCPGHCLELTEPKFHGDIRTVAALAKPEACLGCGICAEVCPIHVITMKKAGTERSGSDNTQKKEKRHMANFFYKAYCRTFQAGMKVGNYFLGYRTPKYMEGPGCIKKLPAVLKKRDVDNVLIVTDSNLMKLGLMNGMLEALDEEGFTYTVFSDLAVNPTSDNVEDGFKVYQENDCQALIAFGGGAPMDCAKGIAAKAVHPKKTVAQLQGILKVHKRIPLFFAIPTTSGTGSETTVAAVITDSETHHKASINDPCIIPKYAILDPELTMGLPPYVTATTGMDALCHAVEAYTNHTYNTKLEDKLARAAVKLIHGSLLKAYENGKDLKARQNMQRAAFFAGRAFTRGCVGYVHAVGHTLGGLYGVPHGVAMSVILPHVMRQFGPAVYKRLAILALDIDLDGDTEEELANAFIDWIEEMQKAMGIPSGFDCIKDEDIPQIIEWAKKEANPLYPVPVIWGDEELRQLIESIRL
ncbi:MAG: iron-containing alcohol dehydrogenase [Lachnospiraceae bacterium]|nr:iron-containing alcohol dehydrogenase [Lachnospiraceae bacterium]